MTDRTLSAAELDAIDATRADEPDGTWSLTMTEAQHHVIMAMARRTEAAERENALLTRALALLCAQGGAVSGHVHTVVPSLETDTVQPLLLTGRPRRHVLRPVPHPPEETPQP